MRKIFSNLSRFTHFVATKVSSFLRQLFTRNNIAHGTLLAGIALAGVGAAFYATGAGWIVGGVGLIVYGYLLGQE